MVRYTLLRLLIFFGCMALLWLIGLRDKEEALTLVALAALLSMVISYFALKPMRQAYSAEIAEKLEARVERKRVKHGPTDEDAEDAEDESYR